MKENIKNYKQDGIVNLDEYLSNNPSDSVYPCYVDGYNGENFWTQIREEDKDEYVYVKPRQKDDTTCYDVYSELLGEELMKQMGIKNADYQVATYNDNLATISKNVLSDYGKDQFIITGADLIGSSRLSDSNDYTLDELFAIIHEYCEFEDIDPDIEEKCIDDIQKLCIADMFTLATDRSIKDLDFIAGLNQDGQEVFELAPLCHNSHCLGADYTEDEIYDIIDYPNMLYDIVDNVSTDMVANMPCEDFYHWSDSLYYLLDENEDNYEFVQKCLENLDIQAAIDAVENDKGITIPGEYKELVLSGFDTRLQNICDVADIDYYRLKSKDEEEKEER